jgi:hypothetical protein
VILRTILSIYSLPSANILPIFTLPILNFIF